jgi:hypothetical protein
MKSESEPKLGKGLRMEWLLWFDVIAIFGVVALIGFLGGGGSTSRRSAGEESRPQRQRAEGEDLRAAAEAAPAPAEGRAQLT